MIAFATYLTFLSLALVVFCVCWTNSRVRLLCAECDDLRAECADQAKSVKAALALVADLRRALEHANASADSWYERFQGNEAELVAARERACVANRRSQETMNLILSLAESCKAK